MSDTPSYFKKNLSVDNEGINAKYYLSQYSFTALTPDVFLLQLEHKTDISISSPCIIPF